MINVLILSHDLSQMLLHLVQIPNNYVAIFVMFLFFSAGHNASWYAVKGDHLEVKVIIDQAPTTTGWDVGE